MMYFYHFVACMLLVLIIDNSWMTCFESICCRDLMHCIISRAPDYIHSHKNCCMRTVNVYSIGSLFVLQ